MYQISSKYQSNFIRVWKCFQRPYNTFLWLILAQCIHIQLFKVFVSKNKTYRQSTESKSKKLISTLIIHKFYQKQYQFDCRSLIMQLFLEGIGYRFNQITLPLNQIALFQLIIIQRSTKEKSMSQASYRINENASKVFMVSDYQIKQKLGKGGFATVRRATHLKTGEDVAVKILDIRHYTPKMIMRIRNQIEVHRKLIHQNIVRLYQVIETQTHFYIFMEMCPNGELFDYINTNGPMQQQTAAKIFIQILEALIYLHKMKISHRDIKTQNILLDYQMNPKIIDFGLCKQYDTNSQQIMLKTLCGSSAYNSPQIVQSKLYNPQLVDVWCLGVALFAMLSAALPFGSQSNPQNSKEKLINCVYPKNHLSYVAKKLISQMLVPQQLRINLNKIKQTQFYMKYGKLCRKAPNYVLTDIENLQIDEQILEQIESQYSVSKDSVRDSITNYRLDKNSSLYYLTIQSNYYKGKLSKSDPQSPIFCKSSKAYSRKCTSQAKNSKSFKINAIQVSTRLESTKKIKQSIDSVSVSTRSKPRKQTSLKISNVNNIFRIKKITMDIDTKLHRSDSSPESPTRRKINMKTIQKRTKQIF